MTVDITALRNEGHFWNSEGTSAVLTAYSGYCAYNAIDVSAGEVYEVSIYRQSSAKQHAVLLTDDNLVIKDSYGQGTGSGAGNGTYSFTVPFDATKMLLTTATDKTAPTVKKTVTAGTLNSVPDLIDRVEDLEQDTGGYDAQLTDIEQDISAITTAIGYSGGETEVAVTLPAK